MSDANQPGPEFTGEMTATSMSRRAYRGLGSTYASAGARLVFQVGYAALISRRLSPTSFGIFAAASAVMQLTVLIAAFGLDTAVTQSHTLSDDETRSSHRMAVGFGIAAAVALAALAAPAAALLDQPQLTGVLLALAPVLIVSGFGVIPLVLLRRAHRFTAVGALETASFVCGFPVAAVIAARAGLGVWALVIGTAIQAVVLSVGAWLLAGRPGLRGGKTSIRSIRVFGAKSLAINVVEYLSANADVFALSRLGETAGLGQYSRATTLVGVPTQVVSSGSATVIFPLLTGIQHDQERMRRGFLRSLNLLGMALFPMCALGAVLAQPGVRVLLGPGWGLAATLVPIVALAVALDLLDSVGGVTMDSLGRLRAKFKLQTAHLAVMILAILIAVATGGGVVAVVVAVTAAHIVKHVFTDITMSRLLAIGGRELAQIYARCLSVAALAAVGGAVGLQLGGSRPVVELAIGLAAAGLLLTLAGQFIRPLGLRAELTAMRAAFARQR
jgi:O-antigen/teichoic acid export membrane protein